MSVEIKVEPTLQSLQESLLQLTTTVQQLVQNQQLDRGRSQPRRAVRGARINNEDEERDQRRATHGDIKIKIPPFFGKSDPVEFLDWVDKVDSTFECQDYHEFVKVSFVAAELSGYASLWWLKTKAQTRHPIEDWKTMKTLMNDRFVPSYYKQDPYCKFHNEEQEIEKARFIDIDQTDASSSSIRGETDKRSVKVDKHIPSNEVFLPFSQPEFEEKVLDVELATCGEDAQALMPLKEEPELEIEGKPLPITNMIMAFDRVSLMDVPEELPLIQDSTNHVEFTTEDGILPKPVYYNEDIEIKENVLRVDEKEVGKREVHFSCSNEEEKNDLLGCAIFLPRGVQDKSSTIRVDLVIKDRRLCYDFNSTQMGDYDVISEHMEFVIGNEVSYKEIRSRERRRLQEFVVKLNIQGAHSCWEMIESWEHISMSQEYLRANLFQDGENDGIIRTLQDLIRFQIISLHGPWVNRQSRRFKESLGAFKMGENGSTNKTYGLMEN
ncbi:unnamed protein product [Linum trigynum]|uniref:Retrotransposon gag domain-containing protein n=1 Tax=Linum trigynum TaxID=586398 RepID=A0AAV2CK79_9ROSI